MKKKSIFVFNNMDAIRQGYLTLSWPQYKYTHLVSLTPLYKKTRTFLSYFYWHVWAFMTCHSLAK